MVHWSGMLVTMVGLVLVGCSSVFKTKHSGEGSKTVLGKNSNISSESIHHGHHQLGILVNDLVDLFLS